MFSLMLKKNTLKNKQLAFKTFKNTPTKSGNVRHVIHVLWVKKHRSVDVPQKYLISFLIPNPQHFSRQVEKRNVFSERGNPLQPLNSDEEEDGYDSPHARRRGASVDEFLRGSELGRQVIYRKQTNCAGCLCEAQVHRFYCM